MPAPLQPKAPTKSYCDKPCAGDCPGVRIKQAVEHPLVPKSQQDAVNAVAKLYAAARGQHQLEQAMETERLAARLN